MSKFQKIRCENQWEYLTYSLSDGTKLFESMGGTCEVKWPDGKEESITFEARQRGASYGDHGKTYDTTQYILGFYASLNGRKVWVDLTDLLVRNVVQP